MPQQVKAMGSVWLPWHGAVGPCGGYNLCCAGYNWLYPNQPRGGRQLRVRGDGGYLGGVLACYAYNGYLGGVLAP
jgi:hypothetical protein